MIKVNNALCRIGRHRVLRVADFTIASGQHWCLFGPNGAGKTLLASLLGGERRESASYVTYSDGFDPARHCYRVSFEEQQRLWQRDNRLDISEYEADAQDQGTRVEDLIRAARTTGEQDEALLEELCQELGIAGLLGRGIRFLSSGQLRRAMLARGLYGALQGNNRLLILDDVLESIDRDSRQRISACISRYLGAGFASLQLCRRAEELPTGISHLAVMQDLALLAQGPEAEVRKQDCFLALLDPQPRLPASLPVAEDSLEEMPETLIELRDVSASYGEQRVLSDVNWTMSRHDHVVVEGPNGSGKSTLLSLIDGDNHKAYGQSVTLFGRRRGTGETVWDIKARFGVVSNELHNKYVRGWRVLDVVVSGFFDSVGLYDDSGSREQDAAREWLAALDCGGLERHYYQELSFGQQRLVLLARAMVKAPMVLVLDEPCVGLDDYHRRLILGLLDLIATGSRTRLVYVSHVPGEEPACINNRLQLVRHPAGAYTVRQLRVQPRI